jgi:toxin-antitoxin system PIN domain toxin
MTAFLLDVNILVALMWPAHESYLHVQNWFARNARRGWATCPFTQAAFVRLVSNPAFSRDAVSPQEAINLLAGNLRHRQHRFWPDDLTLFEATKRFRGKLVGHQQINDSYLLGLAIHRKGKLATMDRAILALLPPDGPERQYVELIQTH